MNEAMLSYIQKYELPPLTLCLKNREHAETIVTGGNSYYNILPGIHTGRSSMGWYTMPNNIIPITATNQIKCMSDFIQIW